MTEIKKAHSLIPMSRELAIDYGLIEPTPEERAEAERSRAAYERRKAEQEARTAALRAALAAVTDPIARAVLDLHAEQDGVAWTTCAGCDTDGYDAEAPPWPCRTVDAVAEALGIEAPS